jgi:hypothetical protein
MLRLVKNTLPLFLLVAASATPVGAEESGKWRGRAVLVVTSEKASEVADKKDHKVRMVEYDGVVFTEVGGDFLANARYQGPSAFPVQVSTSFSDLQEFGSKIIGPHIATERPSAPVRPYAPGMRKNRYQAINVIDAGGDIGSGGYKTFTMSDDSKVFARFHMKEFKPPIVRGEWKFLSGTGRYAGITGNGVYEVHLVSNTVLWDILEGEYKRLTGNKVACSR